MIIFPKKLKKKTEKQCRKQKRKKIQLFLGAFIIYSPFDMIFFSFYHKNSKYVHEFIMSMCVISEFSSCSSFIFSKHAQIFLIMIFSYSPTLYIHLFYIFSRRFGFSNVKQNKKELKIQKKTVKICENVSLSHNTM